MEHPQPTRSEIEEKYNLLESDKYISFPEEKKEIVCDVLIKYNPTKYHFTGIRQTPYTDENEKNYAKKVSQAMNRAINRDKYRLANRQFMRKYREQARISTARTNEIPVQ